MTPTSSSPRCDKTYLSTAAGGAGPLPLLLASPGLAQETSTPPSDEPFFERVAVNIVNVEVYVTDEEGNPVTDLTADDFEIYEDKRAVELVNFYRVTDGGAGGSRAGRRRRRRPGRRGPATPRTATAEPGRDAGRRAADARVSAPASDRLRRQLQHPSAEPQSGLQPAALVLARQRREGRRGDARLLRSLAPHPAAVHRRRGQGQPGALRTREDSPAMRWSARPSARRRTGDLRVANVARGATPRLRVLQQRPLRAPRDPRGADRDGRLAGRAAGPQDAAARQRRPADGARAVPLSGGAAAVRRPLGSGRGVTRDESRNFMRLIPAPTRTASASTRSTRAACGRPPGSAPRTAPPTPPTSSAARSTRCTPRTCGTRCC